jgi:ATP-dependent protease ClpP protease subunit
MQQPQKISITGSITEATTEALRFQLDALDRAAPLLVEINSDGGSVPDGIACFNMLRGWPGGVTVEVVGWALSIASVILQAGTTRRAHESALVMVHAPWTSTTGNADSLRGSADLLDQVRESMLIAYRRTGQADAVIRAWLDGTDHWFTAAEAQALGLIDEVISDIATQPAAPANAMAARHPLPPVYAQRITTMTASAQATNPEAIRAAAVQAESQRRNDISARFKPFAHREGVADLQARCEADPGIGAQAAADRLLAHIGAGCSPIGAHYIPSFGGDNRLNDFKAAAQDVLLRRAGVKLAEPHPGARDLQRLGIVGMAEAILSMTGKASRDMSPSGVISAALSTSDFPALLANTAGKAMALGYESAPIGHTLFTAERDVKDFKPQSLVNLSEAPALLEVPELAEYKNGSMSDSAAQFQVVTHGRILQISRQSLVNDDLSAFTSLPMSFGTSARRLEADKVFGILTANPVLGDGFALFGTEHGNLGAAAALSMVSLGAARSAMRKQKGLAGLGYLDPQPKFLIVPVALETAAEQLLASLVDPSRSNTAPNVEFIRGLTLVADPRLDAVSETAWYLSAAPTQIEGILRAYLAGEPRPYLEENAEFSRDALSYKVRLDFAAGVVDYRGLWKTAGA